MKREKTMRELVKGIITGSVMTATDLMIYNITRPTTTIDGHVYRHKGHTLANIECHIAGMAIGYSVGKRVAEDVVSGYEAAVAAYKEEEIIDG